MTPRDPLDRVRASFAAGLSGKPMPPDADRDAVRDELKAARLDLTVAEAIAHLDEISGGD